MTDLDDIYNLDILNAAAAIARTERLAKPMATVERHSKLCGSTVTVDLNMADGMVSDYGQDVKACLLGQAAAGVMAEQIIGSRPEELFAVAGQMRAMLKANAPPPEGRWKNLSVLQAVKDYPGRHASTLLVFDAVADALVQLDYKDQGAVQASRSLGNSRAVAQPQT